MPGMESKRELDVDELLSRLKKIEELLRFPEVTDNVDAANALALAIARSAPRSGVAELARKVMRTANALRASGQPLRGDDIGLNKALWRLRLAIQEAERDPGNAL